MSSKDLQSLCRDFNLSPKEMVEVIKKLYPKFDKTSLTKCVHSDQYGLELPSEAIAALYEHFAPEIMPQAVRVERRKKDRHRRTGRITIRIENEAYEALQRLIAADGYHTTQEWGSAMAYQYLKSKHWPENRELPDEFDPFDAAEAQVRYCHKNGYLYFPPGGYAHCPRCTLSVYEPKEWPDGHVTGYTVRGAGKVLITCCPHCNYSFVD